MNPMDCKQAQNVWSRVMAAQTAALCTNAEKAPEKTARAQQAPAVSITPEQVMQAMHEELCDAETYRCLAARMSGCARKTLLAISHDERCHAKKLGAIYFLLTGKKACQKKPENPCITCNAEAKREDCSKKSTVLKAHKYSTFGKILSIRKTQDVGISRPICC